MRLPLNPVPSGPPLSFQATPVNSSALRLTWEPPAAEQRNGIIRGYLINATALETGEHFQWMSPNAMPLVVSRLHPNYNYNFIITAVSLGPGQFSDVHSVQMPEDGNYFFVTSERLMLG